MRPAIKAIDNKYTGAQPIKWCLCLAFLLATGCVVSEQAVGVDATNALAATLPTEVLEGTHFLPLSDFKTVALTPSKALRCRAETGGAELSLSISPAGDGSWQVERAYLEPGFDEQTRSYTLKASGNGLISTRENARILGTRDGLLVLEQDADNSFIPPDFWIYYSCEGG